MALQRWDEEVLIHQMFRKTEQKFRGKKSPGISLRVGGVPKQIGESEGRGIEGG